MDFSYEAAINNEDHNALPTALKTTFPYLAEAAQSFKSFCS